MPPHETADAVRGWSNRFERDSHVLKTKLRPPTTDVAATRGLEALVKEIVGRGTLMVCGSFAQGTAVAGSDLDLSLILPSEANRKEQIRVLTKLKEGIVVRGSKRGFTVDSSILTASVPILRLTYNTAGADPLPIDLSIGNSSSGLRDTIVMNILAANPAVKPALAMVKHWAKRRHVTKAFEGYLNSVSWSLLFIRHCQAAGLLPSYNSCMGFVVPDDMPSDVSLLHDFFTSILMMEADGVFEANVLSVLTGELHPRDAASRFCPVWIEDPADADNNVARSTQVKQWRWTLDEVRRSCDIIEDAWGDEGSSETEDDSPSPLATLLEIDTSDAASQSPDSPGKAGAAQPAQPAPGGFPMPGPLLMTPFGVQPRPVPWVMPGMPPMPIPSGFMPLPTGFPTFPNLGPIVEFPKLFPKNQPQPPPAPTRDGKKGKKDDGTSPSPASAANSRRTSNPPSPPPEPSPSPGGSDDALSSSQSTRQRVASVTLPTPGLGRAGTWLGEGHNPAVSSKRRKKQAAASSPPPAGSLRPIAPCPTSPATANSSSGDDGSASDAEAPALPQEPPSPPASDLTRSSELDADVSHAVPTPPCPPSPSQTAAAPYGQPLSIPPECVLVPLAPQDCVEVLPSVGTDGAHLAGDRGIVVDCKSPVGSTATANAHTALLTVDILRIPANGGRRALERVQLQRRQLRRIGLEEMFPVGGWVQARGLVQDTQLNGRMGRVIGHKAKTKSVTVAFSETEGHHVQPGNLLLAAQNRGAVIVDAATPPMQALPVKGDAPQVWGVPLSRPTAPVNISAAPAPQPSSIAAPTPEVLTYLGNTVHAKMVQDGQSNPAQITGMIVELARTKPGIINRILSSDDVLRSYVDLAGTVLNADRCRHEIARKLHVPAQSK